MIEHDERGEIPDSSDHTSAPPIQVPEQRLPEGNRAMTGSVDVYLEYEHGAIARVYCSRCKEQIGRLQMVPDSETGEEAEVRRKEVQGELTLIVDEHRDLCPGPAPT